MMALIALVAMSLTAMALIRSVDTGNAISGNIAFRQSANQFSDIAFETAYTDLQTYITGNNLNSNMPSGCTTNCAYYKTKQALDPSSDIPTGLTWPAEQSLTGYSGFTYSYIMFRLCSQDYNPGTTNPADAMVWCYTQPLPENFSNANEDGGSTPLPPPKIYYQVTVRVTGPRNTTTYAQRTFVAG